MRIKEKAKVDARLAIYMDNGSSIADPWTDTMVKVPKRFAAHLNRLYKERSISPGTPILITATLIRAGGQFNQLCQFFVPHSIEQPLNLPVKLNTVPKNQIMAAWNMIEVSGIANRMETRMVADTPEEQKKIESMFMLFKSTNRARLGPGPQNARLAPEEFFLEVNEESNIARIVFDFIVVNKKPNIRQPNFQKRFVHPLFQSATLQHQVNSIKHCGRP
uniref:Uncharacterized protein n=1 Tax=Panagrolaimus sp. JU765 TaxID=591449 RepID=A0AC34Q9J1_9BILA